jgi:hypothetical protein
VAREKELAAVKVDAADTATLAAELEVRTDFRAIYFLWHLCLDVSLMAENCDSCA